MQHASWSRRDLLRWGAALTAAGGIRIARSQEAGRGRLVVVFLRGGLDGLALVPPHGDLHYAQERPTIAVAPPGQPDGALPLDPLFGLHPSFAPLMPWWERRQLAFVHASGSPDPTRSHFDAQDYMESATPGRKGTPDGWLNRLAGVLAQGSDPGAQRMQTLNLGPTMPRILTGAASVAAMGGGRTPAAGPADDLRVAAAFAELYRGEDAISRNVREVATTRREMAGMLASDDPAADAGALPLAALGRDTARLGRLMARDARIRLAFVPVGSWDTHVNQGAGRGLLANRLALLAQALDALATNLGERMSETTVLLLSEFGRTIRQNGNNGTDHGHGNVAMLLGAGVQGGRVHGEWPGLEPAARHEGRDLAITTDFRDLLADLLERRFGLGEAALATVLPQMPPRRRTRAFG